MQQKNKQRLSFSCSFSWIPSISFCSERYPLFNNFLLLSGKITLAGIDSPGYIFTWDMLGDGNYMATDIFEGEGGTHSEFMEGLLSTDMKKTCDDLACYMKHCI